MRRFNIDIAQTLEALRGKEAASQYVKDCIREDALRRLRARLRPPQDAPSVPLPQPWNCRCIIHPNTGPKMKPPRGV